jgi:CSLREA domain-containing protein
MALVTLACAFFFPSVATAELLTVDSTGDQADAAPGLGGCLTGSGSCTLRAAIEESNSSSDEVDEVIFDEGVFDGQASSTIVLGSSLPTVVEPVRINGRECLTAAGVTGPCVGIDGPAAVPAVTINGAAEVEIEGLALTGAQTGIEVENSPFFRVRASWFGIRLNGDDGGNATGVLIRPGSDLSRVGGEGSDAGNVFGYNTEDGLHVHGAAQVRVLGNYFGVERDGISPAANGKDVEVTSVAPGGPEAVGTVIGTRVSSAAAATPKCDGGCNVISGAATSGVDLEGDGGTEAPAAATTLAGNYVGLNPAGDGSIPNDSVGIHVGAAAQTVIGGRKVGEANRINGGGIGVLAGPAAEDLVVRGNLLGVDAAGTGQLVPPDSGIVVDSEGLASAAVEAVIADNQLRMESGVAITQEGFGAWISDNAIVGAGIGIRTRESSGEHGNLIEGNSIEGPSVNGVLVENDLNEIVGNEVFGAGDAGIAIAGSAPFGATGNVVGGDAASEENVVNGSGGDAIEISNLEATSNEVSRNRGVVNAGLFIDLVAASPGTEPKGPNDGIKPPPLANLTQTRAGGSGAEPGAEVRVFRKRTTETGELESFLGEASADLDGNWEVAYDEAVPVGTIVAATQTSEAGGTSELIAAATPAGSSGSGGGNGSGGSDGAVGGSADRVAPRTKIIKAPKSKSTSSAARFDFDSDEPDPVFQCKLDDRPFQACHSPKKYRGLKPGRHVFRVRAVDPAGNADSTPATKEFIVLTRAGR